MNSSWSSRLILASILLMTVLDGGLFLYLRMAIAHANEPSADVLRTRENDSAVGWPSGFDTDFVRAQSAADDASPVAIRFAAKNCRYCGQDTPLWGQAVTILRKNKYRVITIVPTAHDAYEKASLAPMGVEQLVYVNMGWLARFRLQATPTLLVFGPNGTLKWVHAGVLDASDLSSLARSLRGDDTSVNR